MTAIAGDTLTIVRGQEGTTARTWLLGDYAYDGPTSGQMGAFGQANSTNTWNGVNTFTGNTFVPNATAAGQAVSFSQFPSSLTTNGWKKYPDLNSPTGYFIQQWGNDFSGNGVTVTFPIAFPNACLNVVISEGNAGAGTWNSGFPTAHAVSTLSKTSFKHWANSWNGTTWVGSTADADWQAIGY